MYHPPQPYSYPSYYPYPPYLGALCPHPHPTWTHPYQQQTNLSRETRPTIPNDQGEKPFVVNIDTVTKENSNYRTTLWTGKYLQLTLMSINVGDDIGLEVHPDTDQFIRIEEGQGLVEMGSSKDDLSFKKQAYDDFAIMIPAGTWHNVTNTGNTPLKVYVLYAPPEHAFGTVHPTKKDAAMEHHHRK